MSLSCLEWEAALRASYCHGALLHSSGRSGYEMLSHCWVKVTDFAQVGHHATGGVRGDGHEAPGRGAGRRGRPRAGPTQHCADRISSQIHVEKTQLIAILSPLISSSLNLEKGTPEKQHMRETTPLEKFAIHLGPETQQSCRDEGLGQREGSGRTAQPLKGAYSKCTDYRDEIG